MNIMAIICEYNPFHKGHAYQIQTHKESLKADGVLCLMSGNFVQRGAPSIYDKWTRAEVAVRNGADLVLELPVVYAAQSAMRFAHGAVSLLDALGVVKFLSFGSECGDLDALLSAASCISSDAFWELVKEEMKNGDSFPKARETVLRTHFPDIDADTVSKPNNILALEYLNALHKLKSNMIPKTVKRNFEFVSSSSIREKMEHHEDVSPFVPFMPNATPYDKDAFDAIVSYHFRKETEETLREIADVKEGLENRFLVCANETYGFDALSDAVKTKRYTKTRIDRIIINALLGIKDEDTEAAPCYARVLAFNDTGKKMINEINKNSSIPVIIKAKDWIESENKALCDMLKKDILATDIYALLTDDKKGGKDFTTSPKYIK